MQVKRRLKITKRLLAALIDADIQGAPAANPGCKRLFLLPRASFSDLAVFSNAYQADTEDCASLSEDTGWFKRRDVMRAYPQALRNAHQLAALGEDVEIIPVSVFWSRSAGYEASFAKLLLSERWVPTSHLRRLFEVLVNRKMVQVVCAPPINLGALLGGQTDPRRALRRTARLLRVVFKHQRLALLGPELSLKRRALASVLSQREVRLEIARQAAVSKTPKTRIEQQARRLLAGMISDFSAITLRLVYRFASWCWKWSDAKFTIRGLAALRRHAQSANLVYVPCHQSHLDYIVLSYVLYDQGLALPHIAAGHNLNLPVLGRLLRQCGAFFIRRSFRDDDLYRSLITHYLRLILMRGHTVEFFLEGSRSRTGFLMPAKHGMLEIALSAARTAPPRPLALVPVRYAYERVLDAASYADERGGAAKRGESWRDAVKSFFRLRKGLGQIGIAFGEPVLLDSTVSIPADELALTLLHRINAHLMLTGTHMLALIFAHKHRLDVSVAIAQLEFYIDWLEDCGFDVMAGDAESCLRAGTRQSLIACEQFAGVRWLHVTTDGQRLLPWHRNNALHGLALPALLSMHDSIDTASPLLDVLSYELHIASPTSADIDHCHARMKESGVYEVPSQRALLKALLRPALERHLLVLRAAEERPANPASLVAECLRRAALLDDHLTEPLNRETAKLSAYALLSAAMIESTSRGIGPTERAEELVSVIQSCLPSRLCDALSSASRP